MLVNENKHAELSLDPLLALVAIKCCHIRPVFYYGMTCAYRRDMYPFRTPQKKSYFYPVRTNPHPSQYII
jgi:hypothetical protein